jgi:hypothetical protein
MDAPLKQKKISVALSLDDLLSLVLSRQERIEAKLEQIELKLDALLGVKASSTSIKAKAPESIETNQFGDLINGMFASKIEGKGELNETFDSISALMNNLRGSVPEPVLEDDEDGEEDLLRSTQDGPGIRLAKIFEEKSQNYIFFDKEFDAAVETSLIYETIEDFGKKEGIDIPIWDLDFLSLSKNNKEFARHLHLIAGMLEVDNVDLTDPNLFKVFGEDLKSKVESQERLSDIFGKLDLNKMMEILLPGKNFKLPDGTGDMISSMTKLMANLSTETRNSPALIKIIPLLVKYQNHTFAELLASEELFNLLKKAAIESNLSLLIDLKSYEKHPKLDLDKYAALLTYLQEKCPAANIIKRIALYLMLLRLAAGKPLSQNLVYEETPEFFAKFLASAE